MTECWVGMTEICKHLDLSKETVKKLIRRSGLPAYKPDGKTWKFKISEVDDWVKTKRYTQRFEESGNVKND